MKHLLEEYHCNYLREIYYDPQMLVTEKEY